MSEICYNETNGKGKIKYRTEAAASKAARGSHGGVHLRIYECRFCGTWHLTHAVQLHKTEPPSQARAQTRHLKNRARDIGRQIDAESRREAARLAKEIEAEQAAIRQRQQEERAAAELQRVIDVLINRAYGPQKERA